jgi:hypothetical protein
MVQNFVPCSATAWVTHNSVLICGCMLSPSSTVTSYLFAANSNGLLNFALVYHPSKMWSRQTCERCNICIHIHHCLTELFSIYLGRTVVYIGRSFIQGSAGTDSHVFYTRLHYFNSFFAADLYVIYQAFLFIWCQPDQCYLICTDYPSALQSLNGYAPNHLLSLKSCAKCPASQTQGSLLCFAGYLTI